MIKQRRFYKLEKEINDKAIMYRTRYANETFLYMNVLFHALEKKIDNGDTELTAEIKELAKEHKKLSYKQLRDPVDNIVNLFITDEFEDESEFLHSLLWILTDFNGWKKYVKHK